MTAISLAATYVCLNACNFIAVLLQPLDDADVRQAACSATTGNQGDGFDPSAWHEQHVLALQPSVGRFS